ncbi:hypothetical protein KBTX_04437 [wastewater metagenome]|uniref:CheW-like domain-containing protein n=2 Tax=unclassified sequences TaxID=12908 RepID=A0A6A7SLU7_9ZZZZ|nr:MULTISPECIES: chemotaxis protein CheW [Arhodomonas]MCS4505554.1 chemotaxis protein CheW [Arhodomonas aquaeolei]QEA07021.1 hypothetical protein KBTEX_03365 [uncultured organism]QEA08069.1 hypothetical protein KBTEX_04437 [uncultured organism]
MQAIAPFPELRRLQRLGLASQAALPAREEAPSEWAGVAFRLGSRHLLAPMDEVMEVVTPPALARVPHAQGWVLGIANIRGTLVPVSDLGAFLGLGAAADSPVARVLVIAQGDAQAGVLVDELYGMRHLPAAAERMPGEDERAAQGAAADYITAVFEQAGSRWPVFSMSALAGDPAFLRASA